MLGTWAIISIMVVFIGGIVAYSYGGEKYREYKENKAYKDALKNAKEKEQALKDTYEARRVAREEKYRAAKERRAYIKKEIKRLESLKEGVVLEKG